MKKILNTINESMKELNSFKKILKEAYGDEMGMQQTDPRMTQQDPQMMQQQNMMGEDDMEKPLDPKKMSNHERMEHSMNGGMEESQEENPIANDGQMRNIIDQIRELAIQGIAQYSDNVEDMRYQSLKKIWIETDRFYESFMSDDKKKK